MANESTENKSAEEIAAEELAAEVIEQAEEQVDVQLDAAAESISPCLLYTSPSPRDRG